ncbi:DUF4835 family protein [Hymenobacter sp. 15J16-1T3B]|uniref:type IX secretion system protein PorD n=1 Tax=Hymenobacter sp. 15J16-1T3B TaxID=2886941 RepID=UPI001D13033F|nr:DUF4835 family protein [Hymenobacter sp. 15J16-1T3B]MCC3158753.1 DUF4835 family protein [Hymenobacter sp. 15J16-1T3B]
MLRNYPAICLSLLLTALLALPARRAAAQELLAEVTVKAENVTITDPQLLNSMKNDVSQFLNNRRWTNDVYKPEERIKCSVYIGITSIPTNGQYIATARVFSRRPVYGTSYETTLMSYAESWKFTYLPGQPLDFSENSYVNNLSSILSFYALTIIGMDQDSFAPLGGSRTFDRARNIMQAAAAQNQDGDEGWKDNGKRDQRSRYWLLSGLQDPQLQALRSASYSYYRQGLDVFIQKPEDARTSIFIALQGVKESAERRPGSTLIKAFFETKADEIANLYRSSTSAELKQSVVALLQEVDPTSSAKYQVILQPK